MISSTHLSHLAANGVQAPFLLNPAYTLRPYQQKGLEWLVSLYEQGLSGILADEMGLGKTCQACVALACCERWEHERSVRRSDAPSCVVMPKSLLLNWKSELARFVPEAQLRCVV